MEAIAALGAAKAAFELERGAVARAWIERARERSERAATPAQEAALDAVDALVLIWLEHRLPEGEIVAERAAQAVRALDPRRGRSAAPVSRGMACDARRAARSLGRVRPARRPRSCFPDRGTARRHRARRFRPPRAPSSWLALRPKPNHAARHGGGAVPAGLGRGPPARSSRRSPSMPVSGSP